MATLTTLTKKAVKSNRKSCLLEFNTRLSTLARSCNLPARFPIKRTNISWTCAVVSSQTDWRLERTRSDVSAPALDELMPLRNHNGHFQQRKRKWTLAVSGFVRSSIQHMTSDHLTATGRHLHYNTARL